MRYSEFLLVILFKIFNALKLNFLLSLILYMSTKKLITGSSNNKKKKILILYRKVGMGDIEEAFNTKKNTNFNFYFISRKYLKILFNEFFSDNKIFDYNYKINNKSLKKKQKEYQEKLYKIFYFYNKFLKIDCVLSFNPFYRVERELQSTSKRLNIKFICLHKESVNSDADNKILEYLYKHHIEKFGGDLILTYSSQEKKIILNSKFANKNQVFVTGCARVDKNFRLRKKKENPTQNVVFFLSEEYRGFPEFFSSNFSLSNKKRIFNDLKIKFNYPKYNWKELNKLTVKYLIDFAKRNSEVKIIIKGKSGLEYSYMNNFKLPINCIYTTRGLADEFISISNLVIGFNSTVILEAMVANKKIIIPYFYKANDRLKDNIINFDSSLIVYNKEGFFNKIIYFLKDTKSLNRFDKYNNTLKKYIGNSDGKSSERVRKIFSLFLR